MNHKKRALFSNFTFENWRNVVLAGIICYYFLNFLPAFGHGAVGDDYLAFWSAGKIADEKGYSQIYDLNYLRTVQVQGLWNLNLISQADVSSINTNPVPYFSFFVIPFQFLSRVNMMDGYSIWTFANLIILAGYLLFMQKDLTEKGTAVNYLNLLILMLISYPVLSNVLTGQVEVFLVIFAGEFIRNAVRKKPVLSGIWLAGLLLKPQLLILIIPIFLIMRNWKVLFGFIVSSGVILMTSLLLSGFAGMKALFNLWTKYSGGMASNFVEGMINWRMIGVNVNAILNTSLGWVITGLGMVLTLVAVYFLIKHRPPFGSPQWVVAMLGVFSATLAVTWHSHYHMAMIMIPFLVYASIHKQLPEKIIFLWGVVTPVALFGMLIIDLLIHIAANITTIYYDQLAIASSGFILNLVILMAVVQFFNNRSLKQN